MKINVKYRIEVLGQMGIEGITSFECESLEKAEKKIKSLRSHEMHVHIIKTVYQKNGEVEEFIVD